MSTDSRRGRTDNDLLEACEALVVEHRIFWQEPNWVCPFCEHKALGTMNFPHAADCPVLVARAAIAKATGSTTPEQED